MPATKRKRRRRASRGPLAGSERSASSMLRFRTLAGSRCRDLRVPDPSVTYESPRRFRLAQPLDGHPEQRRPSLSRCRHTSATWRKRRRFASPTRPASTTPRSQGEQHLLDRAGEAGARSSRRSRGEAKKRAAESTTIRRLNIYVALAGPSLPSQHRRAFSLNRGRLPSLP